ncbi:putative glycolipid-binding domain-containing protein [Sulfitobacter sp. THAF37]|uniref:putative glycolipid-binding domain-containing protein n=1 Tax=Sulfitobacter sp. THAF37 TaxID=2587855 RepID=UPI0020C7E4CB|nr:putative glycolipid-binding domain-containing protein [Sulfitobacter sp. THAF37]
MNDEERIGDMPRRVLWRRIDMEGLDACSYCREGDGYSVSGTALYLDGAEPARLEYRVCCTSDWSSGSASVAGWTGDRRRDLSLSRDATGEWLLDGKAVPGVRGLVDIDLGFTPATNTNAIRRLDLAIGEDVETTAVWLDTEDWCFKPLRQVYRRLSETEFAYRSPTHGYAATLTADAFGIVREYPELWTAVSGAGTG